MGRGKPTKKSGGVATMLSGDTCSGPIAGQYNDRSITVTQPLGPRTPIQ